MSGSIAINNFPRGNKEYADGFSPKISHLETGDCFRTSTKRLIHD